MTQPLTPFHEQVFAELDQLRALVLTQKAQIIALDTELENLTNRVSELENNNGS